MRLSTALPRSVKENYITSIAVAICVAAALVPLVWVALGSFKTNQEIFSSAFALPSTLRIDAYVRAWTDGGFSEYLINSLLTAVTTTLITCVVACPAGYQFATARSRTPAFVFYLYLFVMTLPLQAIIIPLFYQLRSYGLLNTRLGFVLVMTAVTTPFACFLMRNFFRGLPRELFESASVDGAGEWRAFWWIAVPLAGPAVKATAVFTFLAAWNEYLLALLILQSRRNRTLPLGVVFFQETPLGTSDYSALFASVVVAAVPAIVLYVALHRSFTRGVMTGAMKG